MSDTPESAAMWAAAIEVRKIIARSKNRRTLLGQLKPTSVAYHAAYAAIRAYQNSLSLSTKRDEQDRKGQRSL